MKTPPTLGHYSQPHCEREYKPILVSLTRLRIADD